MKKNILNILMLLMCGMMMTACGGSDDNYDPSSEGGEQEKDEWNKDNTVNICFITSLSDASANANVEKVANYRRDQLRRPCYLPKCIYSALESLGTILLVCHGRLQGQQHRRFYHRT